MKIKLDSADIVFSQVIRLRDRKCVRCGSWVEFNAKGMPVSHQASHYFGRGCEGTRFELDNVDCLCMGCHRRWGSDEKEEYREFKINQLGQKRFDAMRIQSNYGKKDRKMALIMAKLLLAKVLTGKPL